MTTVYELVQQEKNRQNPKYRLIRLGGNEKSMYYHNVSNIEIDDKGWTDFDTKYNGETTHVHTWFSINHFEEFVNDTNNQTR